MAKTKVKRKNGEVAVIENGGAGGSSLLELQRARNIRALSAKYIADLQEDWEKHGKAALAEYRERFVDRYVENYAMLARVIRLEADVKHTIAKPKTIAEALDELEGKVGKDGRKKFEKFLRSMGEELEVLVFQRFQPNWRPTSPCTYPGWAGTFWRVLRQARRSPVVGGLPAPFAGRSASTPFDDLRHSSPFRKRLDPK